MIKIKEVHNASNKSTICNNILRALPNWFGDEASIIDYVSRVRQLPFYVATDGTKNIGFVAIKPHNPFTAEICVMGILEEYHKQGVGRKLVAECEKYCIRNQIEFLTVKTLDESRASKSYEKTRLFYFAIGFKPVEVFPLFWDEDNPCLFMVKHITGAIHNLKFTIEAISETYKSAVNEYITKNWAGPFIVTKGNIIDTRYNPGFVAINDSCIIGYVLYNIVGNDCEITVLESMLENQGVGNALVKTVIEKAILEGCTRIWLITTNDNTRAIRFYQRIGFNLHAVHINAIKESRKLKPQIPQTGYDDIPIAHEFEFEKVLK